MLNQRTRRYRRLATPRPLSVSEQLRDHYIREAAALAANVRRCRQAGDLMTALHHELSMRGARIRAERYQERIDIDAMLDELVANGRVEPDPSEAQHA